MSDSVVVLINESMIEGRYHKWFCWWCLSADVRRRLRCLCVLTCWEWCQCIQTTSPVHLHTCTLSPDARLEQYVLKYSVVALLEGAATTSVVLKLGSHAWSFRSHTGRIINSKISLMYIYIYNTIQLVNF